MFKLILKLQFLFIIILLFFVFIANVDYVVSKFLGYGMQLLNKNCFFLENGYFHQED